MTITGLDKGMIRTDRLHKTTPKGSHIYSNDTHRSAFDPEGVVHLEL
jgi:hypothetical protein